MKTKTCAVFIFDGFADHEVALTMAWLNNSGRGNFVIETFSISGEMVTSMSGLRVMPQASLPDMEPNDFDILFLPGGDQWEKGDNLEIFPLITATVGRKLIAAVCAGTLALGDLGLLNRVPHTSKFPGYLKQYCIDYVGERFFREKSCVSADGIITANGVELVDLAYEILKTFGILDNEMDKEELVHTSFFE